MRLVDDVSDCAVVMPVAVDVAAPKTRERDVTRGDLSVDAVMPVAVDVASAGEP
jgi:hypothetical protein